MKRNLQQRLAARSTQQRQQYYDRALAPTPAPTGVVTGFDADSGQAIVSVDGGEILADSLTNGAIETGTSVKVQTNRGSSKASIDAMPA